jgi:hypothetical protein
VLALLGLPVDGTVLVEAAAAKVALLCREEAQRVEAGWLPYGRGRHALRRALDPCEHPPLA